MFLWFQPPLHPLAVPFESDEEQQHCSEFADSCIDMVWGKGAFFGHCILVSKSNINEMDSSPADNWSLNGVK
jgi:hypothetical protein